MVGEVEASFERALVQQGILIKLNLPTSISLIQTNCAVCKIYHLPQDQLGGCRERRDSDQGGEQH